MGDTGVAPRGTPGDTFRFAFRGWPPNTLFSVVFSYDPPGQEDESAPPPPTIVSEGPFFGTEPYAIPVPRPGGPLTQSGVPGTVDYVVRPVMSDGSTGYLGRNETRCSNAGAVRWDPGFSLLSVVKRDDDNDVPRYFAREARIEI